MSAHLPPSFFRRQHRLDVARGDYRRRALRHIRDCAACIVDQDVDGPQFVLHRLDRFLRGVPIGYVNLQAEALHAMRLQFLRDRGCVQLLAKLRGASEIDIQYCNVGSEPCQAQSICAAEATRRSRHDRNFSLEAHGSPRNG